MVLVFCSNNVVLRHETPPFFVKALFVETENETRQVPSHQFFLKTIYPSSIPYLGCISALVFQYSHVHMAYTSFCFTAPTQGEGLRGQGLPRFEK